MLVDVAKKHQDSKGNIHIECMCPSNDPKVVN